MVFIGIISTSLQPLPPTPWLPTTPQPVSCRVRAKRVVVAVTKSFWWPLYWSDHPQISFLCSLLNWTFVNSPQKHYTWNFNGRTTKQPSVFFACVIMTSSSLVPTALTNQKTRVWDKVWTLQFSTTPCFALLLNKEWWNKNRLWTFYACDIGQSYTKRKRCRQGCLCFGLCGPHRCSADTGADTCIINKASFIPHAWVANTCRTSADTLPRQSAQKHL